MLVPRPRKPIRRSMKNKRNEQLITMMYSNIQGFTKKIESLMYIMDDIDCDVCLLAETMTSKVKVPGCRVVTAKKSVGQNVCIILRKQIMNERIIKLYEPNEVANMLGIRVELMNTGIRIFTAHLKQQSTNSREELVDQYEEVRKQFCSANCSEEGIIMIMDANVHVGGSVINGCDDEQDWGGKVLMDIINEENLVLMNSEDICSGVITRIDPRNGHGTTLDLVIVNKYVHSKVNEVTIDEKGIWKPANYQAKIKKSTDHNTIVLKAKIERCPKQKPRSYLDTKSETGRELFCQKLSDRKNVIETLFNNEVDTDLTEDFKVMSEFLDGIMKESFETITCKQNRKCGIDRDVRTLMKEEAVIRDTVLVNPDRGRKIFEIRKKIHETIAINRTQKMTQKIQELTNCKNPQSKIFQIRREKQVKDNIGFPLKDRKGITQVSKYGIDNVVLQHFDVVFAQNPIPKGEVWKRYWNEVDDLFAKIDHLTYEHTQNVTVTGPTFEETKKLIDAIDPKKSVLGLISGDLVKLGGDVMAMLIHKCINACFIQEDIPLQFRIEKVVLLYKNSGELSDLDNYRGIFLRYIILSLLQKWIYQKSSPTIDQNGSEFAFGGRSARSVKEVLLIVKLIQDHAKWTKRPLIFKFLDIRKFFDTMNYKTALIEAYKSGLDAKYWRVYKNINAYKTCIPYTPLGECGELEVNRVFVQGSSDAMLMAWNLVDSINKDIRGPVGCQPNFYVEGVAIPRLGFVDDLLEMTRTIFNTQVSCVSNEVFERKHCIDYKPSKCKLMTMNVKIPENETITLDGEILDIVKDQKHLGTIISDNGSRTNDIYKRVNDCKGVLNEIVEVCKSEEISQHRFKYMFTLLNSCFLLKFKHGCEVWDAMDQKTSVKVNRLVPQMIKRVLELPRSTPTNAVLHDFGLISLVTEVEMEKILLTANTLEMSESRIAKRLLYPMLGKAVPGFCSHVLSLMQKFGVSTDTLRGATKREMMKKIVTEFEKKKLLREMLKGSKTDAMLMNFHFNGKMIGYLYELPFTKARIVFMFRARMFPTRTNFKERWTTSHNCAYCNRLDTDEHLFTCWGYMDLVNGMIDHTIFYHLNVTNSELSMAADVLIGIYNRLEMCQNDKDFSGI